MILLDICELIVDCPHSTAKDEGHGFPLIRTPNIGKGRLILDNVHRVCKEVYDKRNIRAIPQVNDIILAREAPAGNVALITKGQKVCLGQRTVLIRPNINKVNPEYLVYYMLSPKVQHDLQSSANGATVAHINMPKIRNLKIQIPNRVIQDKIATILSHYDSLIENYQKQIKLLEESAQRLYKEWFVDLRFPGHENTKIVDGVPEGWAKKRINEFASILSGYAFKSSTFEENGYYNIVTIKNVQNGFFEGKRLNHIRKLPPGMPQHCLLNTGDLLLSLTGNIGRVCMVIGKNNLLNQRVAKIESKYPAFVYCLFRSNSMFTAINNLGNGAAQQNVSPIRIGELEIIFANDEIISNFEKITSNIRKQILLLHSKINLLSEARDRLLPKLMSGEIEV